MNAAGEKGTGVVAQASSSPSLPAAGPAQAPPADDLRRFADWLDAHPREIVRYVGVILDASAREDMVRLAAALGDGTTELYYDVTRDVELRKAFGAVNVIAGVPLAQMRGGQPEPTEPDWDRVLPKGGGGRER